MKKITFLFALLCVSVMGFAIDWSGYAWIGNGSGNAAYTDKFKMTLATGQAVVNIQSPGFATAPGIYTTLPAGIISCSLGAGNYDVQGAGMILHVDAFTAQETEVTVTHGLGTAVFTVYYADGTTGGGGDPDPGTGGGEDPDPAPTGIDWSKISWLTNASGVTGYTEKYKAVAGDPGPSNIDVIQSPAWATKPGLYMTFPSADFRNFSLPASCYSIQGAGIVFHMDAFTAKETTVHVNVGGTVRSFTIYYADGTETPAEIYDINFALADNGSSATASSGTAANAIDGNDGTRWESSATDDETWTLNMGQKRIFNTIKINWENAYCKEFALTYSNDGETWSPLYTETNLTSAGWQTIELGSNVTARYIKYHGTLRATQWGQSFYEFQVLLPGVSVLTSITLNAAAAVAQVGGAGVALTAQPKDQNSNNMEAEVSYEITPAAAGHMSGNTYIPDQIGAATIRAYNGEIFSPAVTIAAYAGSNLALSTNISTDNKVIAQSEYTPSGTDAYYAVDPDEGSVWQGSPTNGNVDDSREYDSWFVLDLGGFYDINMVTIKFEGACSELYHLDFSEDNTTWNLGYNYVGSEGVNGHTDYLTALDNNIKVRYVRFWSTKAATGWGMKIFDMKVFGTEWVDSGDTEAPVMTSASLVSSTATSAVIAVAATDNVEVLKYHVVDATNGIDANYFESEGNITITGLTHNTAYNFTITAVDAANLESENNKVVAVTTPFDVTINLALNKTCEGGYYDNNPAESDDKANDGNNNTQWTTYGAHAIELDWWVVDLGDIYNLTNITILWGDQYATNYILQARVEAPTAADKANDAAWVTLATINDAAANAEKSTNVSGVGRYVRFRATAHTGFMRLKEFRAYASGVAELDTEKPVMTSASLVSNTDVQAVISVEATDNNLVTSYHVVDAGNSIDATLAPVDGKITVTGLTQGTAYTFVIKAIDLFGNESDNSQSVEVTTSAHYTAPQAACAAPTWDASLVKAMYSPTYSADCGLGEWGSGTSVTNDTYGKKYAVGNAYFGMVGFSLNCLMMEKLHFDIWVENDLSIRFVPIWGGDEQGIARNLVGQQWNSIDIDLTDYTGVTNWGNITQFKLDEMPTNFNLWIANAYFYREAAYVDNVAPTNVSASVAAEGFYSVKITASAEDNSGAVSFKVMNGENQVATGAAASGVATTIVVNGLASGTNYNFNVIAYDEAGNEAAPVAVAATTKFMPTPAPAPVTSGKVIVPVYSDALAGALTGIQTGGWGESTQAEWLNIASGDQVFYMQNFNWAGWHSWGASIDATNMMFLHVDFYSTGMTQVSVTPISPGHEGVANCTLTPNAWTSVDVPLSSYSGIDWSDIFQFKFMNPVGGNELMIDNVYFWQPKVTTSQEMGGDETTGGWATFSCAEKVSVPSGLKAYKAAYDNSGDEEVLTLTEVSVIPAGAGVILRGAAAADYAFTLSTADDPDMDDNSLVGCPVRTDVSAARESNDIFCMRYSESFSMTGFFLYEGQYVPAGKAYLALPKQSQPSGAPRRVRFVLNNEQVATGVDNVQGDNVQSTKVLIGGQLYILRGDAVYTIQGVRVK